MPHTGHIHSWKYNRLTETMNMWWFQVSSEKGIESGYFDSDCKVNCPQNCNGTWKTWKNIDDTWEIDSTLTITRPGNEKYIVLLPIELELQFGTVITSLNFIVECGPDVECIAGYTCRDGSCVNGKWYLDKVIMKSISSPIYNM